MVPSHIGFSAPGYIASIEKSAAVLLELSNAGSSRPVPGCPAWTLADLVHHVGAVYIHVAALIRERPASGPSIKAGLGPIAAPPPAGLREWFGLATAELVDAMKTADPADSAWSWSTDETVGFWVRRMCHETVVHQWDAAAAHGERESIDAGLASDGLDEFLTNFVPLMRRRSTVAAHGDRYVFECTGKASASWEVVLDQDAHIRTCRPGVPHEEQATILRGEAQQLLLAFWRRLPPPIGSSSAAIAGFERWFELVGCP